MIINGTAYWFKALGQPRKSEFSPNGNWAFDLSVTDTEAEKLISAGMKKTYLKNKQDDRGVFLTFTRDAIKKDGTAGKPFRVVDAQNNDWDQSVLVGNGSELNVVVSLNERTYRGEKFLKPSALAIQVWELVKYESNGFKTKEDSEDTEPTEFTSRKKTTKDW